MTKIEWTKRPGTIGESWNFIGGCTKVSSGCDNCYALGMSWRIQNMEKRPERYEGVVQAMYFRLLGGGGSGKELGWTGRVNLDYDALEIPYRWKKPRTVFVASMADLFHEKVRDTFLTSAFKTMYENPQHTFIVLTKRARRMQQFITGLKALRLWDMDIPLPNIWLGVTAENQEQADLRIPYLLQTPAAVRWVSAEPMLGRIELHTLGTENDVWDTLSKTRWREGYIEDIPSLDWVVIGCESGPNRREMRQEWAFSLVDQCDAAGVPVFVKRIDGTQAGVRQNIDDWPRELRRSEWPR